MNNIIELKTKNGKVHVKLAHDFIKDSKDIYGVDIEKICQFLINGSADAGNEGEYKLECTWVSNSLKFALV